MAVGEWEFARWASSKACLLKSATGLPVGIYNLVKLMFDNMAGLRQSHKVWEYVNVARGAVKAAIPFHPGAIKYYKEKGIKIPDQLIPPK